MVSDKVFLKASPMKVVMWFGRKRKLSPQYLGPFEILDKVGLVAYHLALPLELIGVHPIFHVSMLRKYIHDPSYVIQLQDMQLDKGLSYEESLIYFHH